MRNDFAHLHVHTEYSLLDRFSRIEKLIERTKEYGMGHLAITDHGVMYGVIAFYKACKQAGIHPILGMEGYLAEDLTDCSRQSRNSHLLLLAKNNTGYSNLLKLTIIAHTEGFHRVHSKSGAG